MDKAILKIIIEKQVDGSYRDTVSISGTEVEVLGMIEKFLIIINKAKNDVVESINEKQKRK